MEKTQQVRLERLARIPAFLDDYAIELGTVSRSPARVELDALVKVIAVQGQAQVVATGEVRLRTLRLNEWRHELVSRHLRPIAAIAGAELAQTPAAAAFHCPSGRERYVVLLDRAGAVALEAAKYRHLFLRHGLARDFVKQLRGAIGAMDRVAVERAEWAQRLKATTADLALVLRRAVHLEFVLNALVESTAGGNHALLAAWDAARRGEALGGRPLSLAS
jgi:hypothetical protein